MYKKIASNTLAQILSKALTAIISIFLIGILTKHLPMELYGSYNKVYNYLGIFAFLADLGLYTIAVREISQKKESLEKIVWNVLTLRTILGLGVWGIAFLIALYLPGYNTSLTLWAIAIVGGFTLVSLINSSILALMQSQMKMEFSLVSLVSGKLINLWLIAYFLVFLFSDSSQQGLAFISVFIGGFIGVSLNTFLNYIYARRIVAIRFRFDRDYILHIFRISLPYGIALFLSVVYFKVDVILLSLLESPEKANISIALYGLPMKIVEVLMVIWWFYLNSLLPSLSKKYTQKKYEELSHIFALSLKILLSFWLFIFMAGNLFAGEIIRIIATPEYIHPVGHIFNSVQALNIVFWVLIFHFLALASIYMLIASEKQSILLWVNLWVTIFNILWNILLIPHYSFLGAAMVTLVSQVILMLITWAIVLRKLRIPKKFLYHFCYSILLSSVLFIVFSWLLWMNTWWDIMTLGIFAPLILWAYVVGEYVPSKKLF